MFKHLIALLIVKATFSYLKVYGPECAERRAPDNIEYKLSNFGEIPYGETIIGKLRLSTDEQLCKIGYEPINTRVKETNTKDILLVRRGGCKFTQKVINAQTLGADAIIIYDNIAGTVPTVVMINDGHGHLAEIPSLLISNTDGLKLLEMKQKCGDLPFVKLQFQIDQKQTSQVTLWVDANNRETYILARDFYRHDYYETVKDRIDFSVRFRVEDKCENWVCKEEEDCVMGDKGEKYCRSIIKSELPGFFSPKGADVIAQQLREYFLWEDLKSTDQKIKWWRYMSKFDHESCLLMKDMADCSYSMMEIVQISSKTIKRVKDNVEETYKNLKAGNNNTIRASYQQSKDASIFFYPQATINGRNFFGLFKAQEVFETICSSLIDPPQECIKFVKKNHETRIEEEDSSTWKTIVIMLAVMILGFLLALFIYTRIIRKEVNQQLSVQVNKMVQNYVNLANKKTGEKGNTYSKFEQ